MEGAWEPTTNVLFSHLSQTNEHYDISRPYHALLQALSASPYPWEFMQSLGDLFDELMAACKQDSAIFTTNIPSIPNCDIGRSVYIEKGAHIESFVTIKGPTYIACGATVRSGAYIREKVFLAPESLVGHSTEIKGSVLLAGAKASHHAYVGDSILGRKVNLGAGTTTGNVRFDRKSVKIRGGSLLSGYDTGLKKLGAFFGDGSQTGCQVISNPGAVIKPQATVMPGKRI